MRKILWKTNISCPPPHPSPPGGVLNLSIITYPCSIQSEAYLGLFKTYVRKMFRKTNIFYLMIRTCKIFVPTKWTIPIYDALFFAKIVNGFQLITIFRRKLRYRCFTGSYTAWKVCTRSFSGPYFLTFGLNTERYSVQMRESKNQKNSEYGHFLRSATCACDNRSFETRSGELIAGRELCVAFLT